MSDFTSMHDTIARNFESFMGSEPVDEGDVEETELEETEVEDDSTEELDEVEGDEVEGEESEEEEAPDAVEVTDDTEITFKIDGEEVSLTVSELKKGYLRQSDYTRKMQALPKKEELEALTEAANAFETLEAQFSVDPELAVSRLLLNITEDADVQDTTNAFVEVAKILAGEGALHPELLKRFSWDESYVRNFQRESSQRRTRTSRELELAERERALRPLAETQEVSAFEQEVTGKLEEVIAANGVDSSKASDFSRRILERMSEDEILDVKAIPRIAKLVKRELDLEAREAELQTKAKAVTRKKTTVARPSGQGKVTNTKPKTIRETIEENFRKNSQ